MFFQQATGTNATITYSPTLFSSLGLAGTSSGLFATGIYGVVKTIAVSLVLMFVVERMGRKMCLIAGGTGQALMMFWIAGYSAIHPQTTRVAASYVSIVALYLYAVFYSIGWGTVPWVLSGEVPPDHARTAATSLGIASNWLFAFFVSKPTPIMLNGIKYGTFIIFGVFCIIMTFWAYFLLPETTGYVLEDIKYLFEDHMVVRALQDAPGGQVFLGGKRAIPVKELRRVDIMEGGDAAEANLKGYLSKGMENGSKTRVKYVEKNTNQNHHHGHDQHHHVMDEHDAYII